MFLRSSSLHGDANRMQRKKTASEKKAQRLRAEGSRIQHTLSALDEVRVHIVEANSRSLGKFCVSLSCNWMTL